jgi:[Skp1-protein]-hydroxyproline N-acetylglucosaminyltransferase
LPSYKDRFAITVWADADASTWNDSHSSFLKLEECPVHYDSHSNFLKPLAIPQDLILNEVSSKKIFVSIINYRDSEGIHTLRDLFKNASFPSRVFVGYVYQGDISDEGSLTNYRKNDDLGSCDFLKSNVRQLFLPGEQATGPCFARHLASKLWNYEDYYLQIDSHMRFRPGWDEYLIHLLEKIKLEQNACNPILTTYPLGYDLPNRVPDDIRATVLVRLYVWICSLPHFYVDSMEV